MLPVLQIWRLALPAAPLAIMLGAWLAAWARYHAWWERVWKSIQGVCRCARR